MIKKRWTVKEYGELTLRIKAIAIICGAMLCLCVLLGGSLSAYTLRSYSRLEIEDMERQVDRASKSLQEDVDRISSIAGDWGPWDETYYFIKGQNSSYVSDNLSDVAFTNLRLSLVAYIDNSGTTQWSRAFDLDTKTIIAPPSGLSYLPADDVLLSHPDIRSGTSGFLKLPGRELMLIAARPITTSDFQAPIAGTIVMGLLLDESEITRLTWRTSLDLAIIPADDPDPPPDFARALSRLSVQKPLFVAPMNAQTISGYTLIQDIYSKPAAILRVSLPRNIYQKGRDSLVYLFWVLVITMVFSSVVVLVVIDRLILKRVSILGTEIKKIGTTKDFSARVEIGGKDELSSLASITNSTLAELESADLALKESLREKELLLREIHHRVKNNLQVVSSLLSLQASVAKSEEESETLRESRSRIYSMALIHELLYSENVQGKVDLARIDFLEYLKHLASYLADTYRVGLSRTCIQVSGDGLHLDADSAITCGLIASELISNALKHAFPEGRSGTVSVVLGVDGERRVTLVVSDDGIGISPELDLSRTESMGWQIITTLADQLRASLEVEESLEGGCLVRLGFTTTDSPKS